VYTVEDVAAGGRAGLHYQRAFAAAGSTKALCVAWTAAAECVVSGFADGTAHVWDAASGRHLMRIAAGGGGLQRLPQQQLCVWAVLALPCGTLVSGDSAGRVQFWDGSHGTLLCGFQQHAADVLALAATPKGDAVFASGVDHQVVVFKRVVAGADDAAATTWVYAGLKRPHTHDVRALAVAPAPADPSTSLLFSGGNDAQVRGSVWRPLSLQLPTR
jgi:U3 small nucleolar RNA-associated protein 4